MKTRGKLTVRLIAAAVVFVVVLGGASYWLIQFLNRPQLSMVVPSPSERPAVRPAGPGPAGFSGKVTDAKTHQPIAEFQARIGFPSSRVKRLIIFRGQPAVAFHNGAYRVNSGAIESNSPRFVRIEALGYLPAVSTPLKSPATADFELQPTPNLQGVVVDDHDQPAAGAAVIVGLPGDEAYIDPADPRSFQDCIQTTTGPDGHFMLPPQIGRFGVVAMSQAGVAQMDSATPSNLTRIHLARWGRIEGTLTLNGKASPDSSVGWEPPPTSSDSSIVYISETGLTDAAGHFHFDHVPQTTIEVHRPAFTFPLGIRRITMMANVQIVTVPAGQTLTMNLGRNGRQVTGRLAIPHAIVIPPTATISGGALPGAWSDPTTQPSEFYPLEIDEAGRFVINDVPAGHYAAQVKIRKTIGGNVFAEGSAEFDVPAITADTMDQPLVIPDIAVAKQR